MAQISDIKGGEDVELCGNGLQRPALDRETGQGIEFPKQGLRAPNRSLETKGRI